MAKPRPSDPMQLAKLVGDIATGQLQDNSAPVAAPMSDQLREWMRALGKMGGKKGGEARDKALSKKRKVEIAKKAAKARWSAKKKP